ncbi:MAG: TIGR03936 family radical SAM-associated protein [Lachnospiraceae bacterium]|nr:TIGR03936 family radical SAM-associated protein [Lachnospiraceae bacterium]
MKVRIKFAKSGVMKYVGHLDIMRYFQKAIRRSGLPIKYSEGFNPHQIMSFAAPLGVGITSEGEYMDIELKEEIPCREIFDRLQNTMVEGMDICKVTYLPEQSKNAMSSLAAAKYVLTYKHPEQFSYTMDALVALKNTFFHDADTIPITKKTKKGERQLDLKPLVYDFDIQKEGDAIQFYLFVSTGSVDNIKPELVLKHFFASIDCDIADHAFFIHRIDMYAKNEEGFVSLGDVGYEK